LSGAGTWPFFASLIVWYRFSSMISSWSIVARSIESDRAQPIPPPFPASMKLSCGRV